MKRVSSSYFPVLSIDRTAAAPLHRQVYDAFRNMILSRTLRCGEQVPSTRALALELGISRIPVLTAYDQLLAEGYFESRTGSGTFVCSSLPDEPVATAPVAINKPVVISKSRRISHRASTVAPYIARPWFRGLGAFSVSQPAYQNFPFHIWSNLVNRHARSPQASSLHYSGPLGIESLRQAICTYLRTSRAVRCEPDQVMIVSGSQQALEISARVLLDPEDPVWLEEPSYWLTRRVLEIAGCRLVPVPVDSEGLDVTAGMKANRKARAALVAPSHQFPLGSTMSLSRRLQLLNWAESAGAWIVEDDYDSEYRYSSMPVASLQGLDTNSRVIYIGTFSKVLYPSLRVGYLVIPRDLAPQFSAIRHAMDLGPAHLTQAVLADFINEGHFARHIRRMRQLYSQRRTALVSCVQRELGPSFEILGAEAGMFLALALPKHLDDIALATQAAREKLWLAPLSPTYLKQPGRPGFILGFGSTPAEEMPAAVHRLKSILFAEPALKTAALR